MMKCWWISIALCCLDGGLKELTEALESRHIASRRVAIRGLAELGSPEAWELVLEGLADPAGEVADEAQWQLAHAPLGDALLGRRGLRSSDPWVRQRTAELFGRATCAVDGWDLARHLSRREPEFSATLAWSLERLARAGSLAGDRERCAKGVARAVRYGGQAGASALACLQALGGEEVSVELDRAAKGRDVLLRAAADAAARGFEVWIGGLGSEQGSPISIAGEPALDPAGRAVRTIQNADLLRAMAEASQGRYEDITEDEGLDALVDDLRDLSGDSREGPAEPFDTTALFALLAIPLLLWEGVVDARRGVIGDGTNQRPDEPDAVRGHDKKDRAA